MDPSAAAGRRKRALQEDDEGASGKGRSSLDAAAGQVLSPQYSGEHGGLHAGGHAGGATKSRKLSQTYDNSPITGLQAPAPILPPAPPVPQGLQSVRLLAPLASDAAAASTPSGARANGDRPFVVSPFGAKQKPSSAMPRSLFGSGGREGQQTRPVLSGSVSNVASGACGSTNQQRVSPPSQLRRMARPATVRPSPRAAPVLTMDILEEKASPPFQSQLGMSVPLRPSPGKRKNDDPSLPALSHYLVVGPDSKVGAAYRSLTTPYRPSVTTVTTAPSSKQVSKRQPFPFPHGRTLEAGKSASTPLIQVENAKNAENALDIMDRVGISQVSSFDDVPSSDEELIGIPDPDIPDPDISYSQEALGDLSFSETDQEESTSLMVLTLCQDLADTLSRPEREKLELLNVYSISLTAQPSPIILGRDPFYEVFGESIRGGMTFHLSRRHCLFHVTKTQSPHDASKTGIKVSVENTSANGIEVNGRALKNGQFQELELGDVITLLRIRSEGENKGNLSLAYKMVRAPHHEKIRKRYRRSRRDGRFVRPGDKFSCELGDASKPPSSGADLSPASRPAPVPFPLSMTAQSLVSHDPIATEAALDTVVTPVGQTPSQIRKINCKILLTDPSSQEGPFSQDSTVGDYTLEGPGSHFIEGLSGIFSVFNMISSFETPAYDCATASSIKGAFDDDTDVLIYAGGGDESHVIVDGPEGMPARLERDEMRRLFAGANADQPKLIVVPSNSSATASMLAECGAAHVCYVSSANKHFARATAFLRALFAGFLKGFSVEKSYALAELVALNDLLPIVRPADQICELIPNGNGKHDVIIGRALEDPTPANGMTISTLNAPFIPMLATHFIGREEEVRKIESILRRQKVRVCCVHGPRGVGKSAVAIRVARWAKDVHLYSSGVHFFPISEMCSSKFIKFTDEGQARPRVSQHDDVVRAIVKDVDARLHSLPSSTRAQKATALLILDGCDVLLPSLGAYVAEIAQRFPHVQILLTSTQELKINANEDEKHLLPEQSIRLTGLSEVNSARLLYKLAKDHLTSEQLRQVFPDKRSEAIAKHEALRQVEGNPFSITRLPYSLEAQLQTVEK